jgi:hypothetical protein
MDVDRLIASLEEARDYYQNMLKHASSQLEHIQALIDGFGAVNSLPKISSQQIFPLNNSLPQSEMNGSDKSSAATKDLQAETKQPESKPEAVNSTPIIEVPPAPEAVTIPTPDIDDVDEDDDSSDIPEEELATATLEETDEEADEEADIDDTEDDASDNSFVEPPAADNSTVTKNPSKAVASTPAKRSVTNNSRKRRPARQIPPLAIPFAPKMAGMRLGDAIESVLREHPETVSHTDYIVRAIYGQLEGIVLRTAKDRVTKELSRGYKLGRWYRLPDTPGCYTVSRRLAQSKS